MRLIAGKDFWRSAEIPDLQIGSLKFTDGPNGARGSEWTEGKAASCFPCATAIGATFDRYLACEVGKAIAQDAIEKNATGLLAPTMNIHRYLLSIPRSQSYLHSSIANRSQTVVISSRIAKILSSRAI